jgi:hypothetical protein
MWRVWVVGAIGVFLGLPIFADLRRLTLIFDDSRTFTLISSRKAARIGVPIRPMRSTMRDDDNETAACRCVR